MAAESRERSFYEIVDEHAFTLREEVVRDRIADHMFIELALNMLERVGTGSTGMLVYFDDVTPFLRAKLEPIEKLLFSLTSEEVKMENLQIAICYFAAFRDELCSNVVGGEFGTFLCGALGLERVRQIADIFPSGAREREALEGALEDFEHRQEESEG